MTVVSPKLRTGYRRNETQYWNPGFINFADIDIFVYTYYFIWVSYIFFLFLVSEMKSIQMYDSEDALRTHLESIRTAILNKR